MLGRHFAASVKFIKQFLSSGASSIFAKSSILIRSFFTRFIQRCRGLLRGLFSDDLLIELGEYEWKKTADIEALFNRLTHSKFPNIQKNRVDMHGGKCTT